MDTTPDIHLTITGTGLHARITDQALAVVDDELRADYERTVSQALTAAAAAWDNHRYDEFAIHLARATETLTEIQRMAVTCGDRAGYDEMTARAREIIADGERIT
ncbi:hypothetical protein [Embleya sp. NPDC005971]|uniref:hypothetical protein n=1 Tax=Embleya sp. NPDC005971 TaxID=3156724 RepID=UPI0033C6624C